MKNLFLILAMATVSFVFSICSGNNIPIESHWALKNLYSNGNEIEIPLDHNPAISFLKEGKISGETGCNRFFGDFSANDKALTFSNMGSTRMMCPQMEFEGAYLTALDKVSSYIIHDDSLVFKDNEGNIIAVLERITSGTLEN